MSMNRLLVWSVSRLAVLMLFAPSLQRDLFVPFLSNPNLVLLDPWNLWVEMQGRLDVFPYGIVMFKFFLPAILIHNNFEQLTVTLGFTFLISVTLLAVEYFSLKLLLASAR